MLKKITYNISNIIFPWIVAIVSHLFLEMADKAPTGGYDGVSRIGLLIVAFVFLIFIPACLYVHSSKVLKRSKLRYAYAVYNSLVIYFVPRGYWWCEEMIRKGRISRFLLIISVIWIMANLFWSFLPFVIHKCYTHKKIK